MSREEIETCNRDKKTERRLHKLPKEFLGAEKLKNGSIQVLESGQQPYFLRMFLIDILEAEIPESTIDCERVVL